MSCRGEFSSWLAPHFARFVAMKRACGAQYEEGALLLAAFDRHVCDQAPSPPLGREVLLTYLDARGHLCDRSRDNVVTVVWQAVEFAARHGARVDPLPPRPLRPRSSLRLRQPRVLAVQEAGAVLRAARELPPAASLRSATCATLFGLLLATGIRIGEALALCVEDLDLVQGSSLFDEASSASRESSLCASPRLQLSNAVSITPSDAWEETRAILSSCRSCNVVCRTQLPQDCLHEPAQTPASRGASGFTTYGIPSPSSVWRLGTRLGRTFTHCCPR